MAETRRLWNIAEISGDELEPVTGILLRSQSLKSIAEQRILASEFEFNNLARCQWEPDSEDAKRFYFLRWEHEALQNFVKNPHQHTGTFIQRPGIYGTQQT